jgi:hypothetical protein
LETAPDICVPDALDALRLAVGREPRFGPATPFDLIAADIDRDGEVSVGDALDILRFGVGIGAETAPRWVFVDEARDLSGITAQSVTHDTGPDVDTTASGRALDMTGILRGNVESARAGPVSRQPPRGLRKTHLVSPLANPRPAGHCQRC